MLQTFYNNQQQTNSPIDFYFEVFNSKNDDFDKAACARFGMGIKRRAMIKESFYTDQRKICCIVSMSCIKVAIPIKYTHINNKQIYQFTSRYSKTQWITILLIWI